VPFATDVALDHVSVHILICSSPDGSRSSVNGDLPRPQKVTFFFGHVSCHETKIFSVVSRRRGHFRGDSQCDSASPDMCIGR